jgi:hypothetical protein
MVASATAIKLKKLLPTCPVCPDEIVRHHFAIIASLIVSAEDAEIAKFLGHIRQHEWNDLNKFKNWRGSRDNLLAYFIACPNGGGTVIAVRSPFGLYDSDEIYLQETITSKEQTEISRLVSANGWQTL